MICFSSKREFSSSKFILNVQPLIFKQIDHQIGILLRNPPLIGSNRKIRNKTPYNKYVYQVPKKSLQSFGFAAELDRQICPIFLLSTLKLFFSKQQTPATEKMMVQYFTTVCQQRVFLLQFHQNHCILKEKPLVSSLIFSTTIGPLHFQKFISYSRKLSLRRSKKQQPSSKINEFFMI